MAKDQKVKEEALQMLGLFTELPRLVVFDLDYTLWPFYCDCCGDDGPYLFPHARGIIDAIQDRGIDMAIASRSHTFNIATTFLEQLGIRSIFVAEEIFPSSTHKTKHFEKIQKTTGVPYESMLFFDDEDRNTEAISKIGVTSILVHDGVTLEALRKGLSKFSQASSSNSIAKSK